MAEELETDRWYWDRRNGKALYPRSLNDNTIEFVTIWHTEEVADALDNEALVPIDDIDRDWTDTTFDLIDSFRTPEEIEREASKTGVSSEEGRDA